MNEYISLSKADVIVWGKGLSLHLHNCGLNIHLEKKLFTISTKWH